MMVVADGLIRMFASGFASSFHDGTPPNMAKNMHVAPCIINP